MWTRRSESDSRSSAFCQCMCAPCNSRTHHVPVCTNVWHHVFVFQWNGDPIESWFGYITNNSKLINCNYSAWKRSIMGQHYTGIRNNFFVLHGKKLAEFHTFDFELYLCWIASDHKWTQPSDHWPHESLVDSKLQSLPNHYYWFTNRDKSFAFRFVFP